MYWATRGIFSFLTLAALNKCTFSVSDLYLDGNPLPGYALSWLNCGGEFVNVRYLYELRSPEELLPMTRKLIRTQDPESIGYWLGNIYNESRGGWYNPYSGGDTNEYLNSLTELANPKCPVCCLHYRVKANTLTKVPTGILSVMDCEKRAYRTPWINRTHKKALQRDIEKLKQQIEQIKSGRGPSVRLDFDK